MSARRVLILGLVALMATGCISVEQATAAPTEQPTLAPTEPPTAPPTAPPTEPPTEGPPTPTPDPNATPRPTALDIAPYLTSQVTVVNLADTSLALTVALLDPDSTDEYVIGTFDLAPDQVTTQSVIPALFRIDFAYGGGPVTASCSINIADGEQLQFAVVATGIVMASNGTEPADAAEMIVATSARCQEDTTP
jgi:hypothetical protein